MAEAKGIENYSKEIKADDLQPKAIEEALSLLDKNRFSWSQAKDNVASSQGIRDGMLDCPSIIEKKAAYEINACSAKIEPNKIHEINLCSAKIEPNTPREVNLCSARLESHGAPEDKVILCASIISEKSQSIQSESENIRKPGPMSPIGDGSAWTSTSEKIGGVIGRKETPVIDLLTGKEKNPLIKDVRG